MIVASLSSAILPSETCNDVHDCRTVPTILYICISTIFLCTWAALHPNVPDNPWEPGRERVLRRIGWMVAALLAPELVLFKAARQWTRSCKDLKEKLERDPTCDWTETHAMLARMGGIRLVNADGTKRPHAKYSLVDLPSNIEMPTKEEIQDKSKGDYVAKAITVVQTLWFAIQAAHRVSRGLILTELELTTFGHVVLNIFIYWCWWNKPLNIRFPIDVYPRRRVEGGQDGALGGSGGGEGNTNTTTGDTEAQTTAQPLPVRVRIGANLDRYSFEKAFDSFWVNVFYWVIGGMFGAIHCLAWNSTFPTGIEHSLWRACALLITVLPGATLAFTSFAANPDMSDNAGIAVVMMIDYLAAIAYSLARICLLVIAFTALRALPFRAYEAPSWSSFMPHIG